MASRDRLVVVLPKELTFLLKIYQEDNRIVTKNVTIQRLLETHPALVELAEALYPIRKGADLPRT